MQTVMIHYNQDPVRPLLWSNWIDLVAPRALFTAQSYSMQLTVEMCERTVVTLARGPRSYEEAICLTHSARTHTQVQIGSADSNQSSSFIGWATGGKKDKIASKKERQRETETNTETQTEAVMKAEVKRVRGEKKRGTDFGSGDGQPRKNKAKKYVLQVFSKWAASFGWRGRGIRHFCSKCRVSRRPESVITLTECAAMIQTPRSLRGARVTSRILFHHPQMDRLSGNGAWQ